MPEASARLWLERLLAEGACVVLADRDAQALDAAQKEMSKKYGRDVVRAPPSATSPTKKADARAAFDAAASAYGGIDIVVANAGLASSATIEETTIDIVEQEIMTCWPKAIS